MSTSVYYKGAKLIDVDNNTKTLLTAGKYLEDDVTLTDVTVYQTHTVTLTNSGSNYMAYIEHNGVSYYSSDDVIDVSDGDTIKIWLNYGNNNILYVNEEKIAEATAGMAIDYTYTVTSDVEIRFSLTFGTSSVSLTEISDIQALSVTENGTYTASGTTRGYSPVTVNVPNPLTSSLTVTPTESQQTFNATGVYGYKPVTVNGISSTYVGSGIPLRSSADVYLSDTKIRGPKGYYSVAFSSQISTSYHQNPTIDLNFDTGVITAFHTAPLANYLLIGAATTSSIYQLNSLGAQTLYPSTADQTIVSRRWLTGTQTIKSVTTSNLTAENIAEGVVVKVGDATNASRITQITGTHSGAPKYTATIISAGVSSAHDVPYCYVRYPGSSGSKYADLNTTIDFSPGDEMLLYAVGYSYTSPVSMYINDELVSYSTMVGSYLYTLPSCDINISLNAYTNPVGVKVYSPIIPSGTSEITSNGTYNVYGYSAANVSVSSNDFLVTLSQNAYSSFIIDKTYNEVWSAYNASKNIAVTGNRSPYYTGDIWFNDHDTSFEVQAYTYLGDDLSAYIHEEGYVFYSNSSYFDYSKNYYEPHDMNATPSDVASGKRFINASGFQVGTATGGGGFTADQIAMRTISGDISGSATTIGNYTFSGCSSLTAASFPNATRIGTYAFFSCTSLTTISFPNATIIGNYAFSYCSQLTTASFPSATSIGNSAFCSCFNLLSFYLLGSSVPTLGINVFYSTPIGGYTTYTNGVYGSIFVPSSLYDQYIVATNWSAYSSRIVSV